MIKVPLCVVLLLAGGLFAVAQNPSAPAGQYGPTSPPQKIRTSPGILKALIERGARPAYPEQAIKLNIEGTVTLVIQVSESGEVIRSLAVEGDPLLVAASVEALKEFHFRPYLLNGKAVLVESQIAFRFQLTGKGEDAKGSTEYSFDVPYRTEFRTGAINQDGILALSPRKLSGPDPMKLPELSGQVGSLYLKVTIGEDGRVSDVKVIAGDQSLAVPVVAALRQSVYEPELINGVPAQVVIQESYHFGGARP